MEPDFWRARWVEGRIGFHEGRTNAHLERHVGRLGQARRVLVPLCGKAVDLEFLAERGHQVVGVELVEDAVRAYFQERGQEPQVRREGGLAIYQAGPVTLVAGDFFATDRVSLGEVDALYDRAALIALPPPMRVRYALHVRTLIPRGAPGLLVTMEYPQDKMPGPPFSVPEDEVHQLYAGLAVERLDDVPAEFSPNRPPDLDARVKSYFLRF